MAVTQIGTVRGATVETNKDGDKPVLMLQVEITDPEDVQAVQLMTQAGEESNPPDGSRVTLVRVNDAFKIAVAVDDGIEPSMGRGEKKLYSTSSGAIAAFINLLTGGNIELNGNADNAVRYAALESAIDDLADQVNTFIAAFNTHTHSYLPGPGSATPTAPPAAPGVDVVPDITGSKVDEVTLP